MDVSVPAESLTSLEDDLLDDPEILLQLEQLEARALQSLQLEKSSLRAHTENLKVADTSTAVDDAISSLQIDKDRKEEAFNLQLAAADPFYRRVVPILYDWTEDIAEISAYHPFELEKEISLKSGKPLRSFFSKFPSDQLHYRCTVVITTGSSVRNKVAIKFLPPEEISVSCEYFDHFGANRFLFASLTHGRSPKVTEEENRNDLNEFFNCGISFGGRHYAVLGGELPQHSKDKSFQGAVPVDQDSDEDEEEVAESSSQVRLWMFAEYDDDGYLPTIPVSYLRDWLGTFPSGTTAAKLNARIKLGFSKTIASCKLQDKQIILMDDVISSDGCVMTDGCGFISDTLAADIPYDVSHGRALQLRHSGMSLPAMIQMRLRCDKGLFKGCLLVVNDVSICPSGCIVLRSSMKKADRPSFGADSPISESVLRVNSTFEHRYFLEPKAIFTAYEDCSIVLSRTLCLLLHALGVPFDFFELLMTQEINAVVSATTSRKKSYDLVRRFIRTWIHPMSNSFSHKSSSFQHKSIALFNDDSLGLKALRFLLAGHDLTEPMLQHLLKQIQLKGMTKLEHCRMRLSQSVYLVGAPDPTGLLLPHEVYVILPKDRNSRDCLPYVLKDYSVVGSVAVTRSPMFHPGDIRVLRAVENETLQHMFLPTSGGIILFSTQGRQTPAAYMSGGDFDGDSYCIIYNRDIVNSILEVPPFTPCTPGEADLMLGSRRPVVVSDQFNSVDQPMKDPLGYCIFQGLMKDANDAVVGRYGNALKAWLDPSVPGGGPNSRNANKCYSIYLLALDAAKSGIRVFATDSLLRYKNPHYLAKDKDHSIVSSSVAGKLFDLVRGASESVRKDQVLEIMKDPETTYRHANSKLSLEDAQKKLLADVYKTYSADWIKHRNDFNCCQSRIFGESSNRNQNLMILREQFRSIFDADATEIMKKRCRDYGFFFLFAETGEATLLEAEDVEILRNEMLSKAKHELASVVYLTSYNKGNHLKNKFDSPGVSFCWEICPLEIHRNKAVNVSKREMSFDATIIKKNGEEDVFFGVASSIEVVLSSEMIYL